MFLALLTGEARPQEDLDGLFEVLDLVDRDQAMIITSSVVRTEILDDEADPSAPERLEQIFARPTCVPIDVNRAISEKAGKLRTACKVGGRTLKTPDALFIATALLHGADALHTFDDRLLRLDGQPEVDGLHITKPHGRQTALSL